MRGRLFTFAAAISLLLFLIVAGLWISVRRLSQQNVQRRYVGQLRADGTRARVILAVESECFHATQVRQIFTTPQNPLPIYSGVEWHGLQFAFQMSRSATLWHGVSPTQNQFGYYDIVSVAIPYWVVLLASSILPLLWIRGRRWLIRARQLGKRCPGCGYDLRATPERCPECGRDVPGAMDDADAAVAASNR